MSQHDHDHSFAELEEQLSAIAPAEPSQEFAESLKAIPNQKKSSLLPLIAFSAITGIIIALVLKTQTPAPSPATPTVTTISSEKIDRIVLSATDEGIFVGNDGTPLKKTRYQLIDVHTLPLEGGKGSMQVTKPVVHVDFRPVDFY